MIESTSRHEIGPDSDDTRSGNSREGGWALAVSLIAILVVSLLAAAGYSMSNFELNTSREYRARTEAFLLADRGLNQYLAREAEDLVPSVTYEFETGEARVWIDTLTLGMANDESMFRASSTGEHVTPANDTARRTLSTVLLATPLMPIYPSGAFVSGGGVYQNGMSATYDGNNAYTGTDALCSEAGVSTSSTGSVVSDSFEVAGGGPGGGECESYTGATPQNTCDDDALSDFMSAEQWQDLRDLEADHVVAGSDSFPQTDGYEVVKSSGDYQLDSDESPGSGQGILIVEGDLTFNGDFTWDGLVLVGGALKASNGKQVVNGGIVTGLNELIGGNPSENQIGNGTKIFQYNSCNLYKASTSKYRVSRVPSTLYESR